jgi:hypothetical protein
MAPERRSRVGDTFSIHRENSEIDFFTASRRDVSPVSKAPVREVTAPCDLKPCARNENRQTIAKAKAV